MLLRRYYDDRLAQASFLVGCQETGEAIVIDPARDISPYLDAVRQEGVRITRVTETHIHADFVSGTRELAEATGAEMLLSAEGGDDWQYRYPASDTTTALHDGDVTKVGSVRVAVMHTPGHTPEHLAFVVTDTAQSGDPVALISGDFLFVGDVGRPDLLEEAAGVTASKEPSARALFRSLQRLDSLPDRLLVWPGHGAGSACGKSLGAMPSTTLGHERRANWAFQLHDEPTFVAAVLEGQPATPPYFGRMKRVNRDGAVVLGERGAVAGRAPSDLAAALRDGVVVDIRALDAYATAHIPGTLNIPLTQAFTRWAGWLLPYDRELYLIAPDAPAAGAARQALASIGLDRVAGAFGLDVIATSAAAGTARTTKRSPMTEAARLQHSGRLVVDVRDASEWGAGHLGGAVHHPLGRLPISLSGVQRSTPLAVHCEGGTRSAIAASLLETMGFSDVIDLIGGWHAWQARPATT
ncbi:MAG: MBL fold metallo-hydrolase [Gemmatimonadales bacterium]